MREWGTERCVSKIVFRGKIMVDFGLMSTFQHISVKQNIYCALIRYFLWRDNTNYTEILKGGIICVRKWEKAK